MVLGLEMFVFHRDCLLCCVSSELGSSELHWIPISCTCTSPAPKHVQKFRMWYLFGKGLTAEHF